MRGGSGCAGCCRVMAGIGLAGDKQALAVVDHDVRVLARKMVRGEGVRAG